ncbi:DEAD/DEAH box helicase [Kutzneria viridogrisea]|uniref:SNF2-like protein n=2 Tax=Kutzneria TaxID=43356 RepID=W5W065_9PSEU|nr:DEAD/DEAH box helicase [Kutzneria albida]AHH94135.1 SNF2-like protein [Kutzneria albida DSM 43870]MBA8929808.1 superfamily II DNA or RNA helicase [Kutzneria viridogrisea]
MDYLARCSVDFEPADPPRQGRVVFWHPDGAELPEGIGEPGEAHGHPALRLPVAAAVRVLSKARTDGRAHPSAQLWGQATVLALQLVARGRLRPAVTSGGFDAWRVGPLEAAEAERVTGLGPDPELVREFLDAVADGMPRSPAAIRATGQHAFAARAPQRVEHLRGWAAGFDSAIRVSLRVEVPGGDYHRGAFTAVVQLHSLADPALVADLGGEHGFGPRALVEAAVILRRAARVWSPLDRLLHLSVPDELVLADEEVGELLGWAATRLAATGVEVHWPRELVRDLAARAVLSGPDSPPSDLPSMLGGGELFAFDWQLALGGQQLSAAELDQLAQANRPVVRLRDQWLLVDPELARKARERGLKPLSAMDALGAALTGTAEVDGEQVPVSAEGWLEELRQRIAEADDGQEPLAQPAALAATLRDYQLRGLRWLDRMTSLGLGGCLADDMGLGKTITLIALHLHRGGGPTLVVCPASLLGNWEREVRRFAPGTQVRRYHGGGRNLAGITGGFVLTTYGTMRLDAAELAEQDWDLVVADEAQHVKNPASGTARALRTIPGRARVALTGTPVENTLSELWAILDWTTPGLLGSLAGFRARWAKSIESDRDSQLAQRFAQLVRPFLLRRRKSDPGIAPELPAKTETEQAVALTREQAALYEAVVREAMAEIRGSSGMARRGLVFKLLTALKQVCNHPAQYLREDSVLAGRSGKLALLDELLDTILAEGGAVLVFTQYVGMARLIERHLADRGVPTQFLHGGTPVAVREQLVQRFQDGAVPVFLLSLKAAGTGLNLTRADHVVHYDRWWNPAVEDQATDRAYRIGQTRPVQVHKLITEGTVEERVAEMLRAKRGLAESVLGAGEAAFSELSDTELAGLVELRGRA